MLESLKGKRTYLTCIGMMVFALLGLWFGFIDMAKAGEIFLQAFAIAGLRAGIQG